MSSDWDVSDDELHRLCKLQINYDKKTVTQDMKDRGWSTDKRNHVREMMKVYKKEKYWNQRDRYELKISML